MVNPDPELRGEGGGGVLLALPTFLPYVISSFFTQKKGGQAPGPLS